MTTIAPHRAQTATDTNRRRFISRLARRFVAVDAPDAAGGLRRRRTDRELGARADGVGLRAARARGTSLRRTGRITTRARIRVVRARGPGRARGRSRRARRTRARRVRGIRHGRLGRLAGRSSPCRSGHGRPGRVHAGVPAPPMVLRVDRGLVRARRVGGNHLVPRARSGDAGIERRGVGGVRARSCGRPPHECHRPLGAARDRNRRPRGALPAQCADRGVRARRRGALCGSCRSRSCSRAD